MRVLAVARFRFWTIVRSSAAIFSMALGPAFAGVAFESITSSYMAIDAGMLAPQAFFVLLAWLVHGAMLIAASQAFGNPKTSRSELTAAIADLMDSVPVHPRVRFAGEWLGIFSAMMTIHLCCLPALVLTAVLSPLPMILVAYAEAVLIPLMILASGSATWRRLGPQTSWSNSRLARSGLLFIILALLIVAANTDEPAFRDAAFAFFTAPSMPKWHLVAASIDDPFLLLFPLALLYAAYLAFFYISSTRDRALEISA